MRGGDPLTDLRGIALGGVAAEQPAGQRRDEFGQLRVHGGGRGDQFVTITVTVPKNMTSEQKERLRAYAEAMNESVSEGRSGIFGNKKKR